MLESNSSNHPIAEDSRDLVLAFYNEALVRRSPRTAFMRFMSPDFIEYKPDIEGGTRSQAAEFLEGLMENLPNVSWEVVRTVAEGNLVVLHARFTPSPGAPAYAIADFFRVQHGLIVEHWDVVAGPPSDQRNPNSRF